MYVCTNSMWLSALTTQSARLEGNAWAGQNAARFIAFECLPSPSTTPTNDITLSPSLSPVSSVPTSSPQTFVCCNPPRMIFYCFCQEEQCYLWLSVVFFVLCPSVTIKMSFSCHMPLTCQYFEHCTINGVIDGFHLDLLVACTIKGAAPKEGPGGLRPF